jgi:hypothetical protein
MKLTESSSDLTVNIRMAHTHIVVARCFAIGWCRSRDRCRCTWWITTVLTLPSELHQQPLEKEFPIWDSVDQFCHNLSCSSIVS